MNPNNKITIAVDATGGDNAPNMVFEALSMIVKQLSSEVDFKVFCHQEHEEICKKLGVQAFVCEKETDQLKTTSSNTMKAAVAAVKNGHAHACVSAGNTIFYLIEAIRHLNKLPSIRRPALISSMPSNPKDKVLVDIGANLQCSASEMAMFAVMGRIYAMHILDRPDPSVSFLNVGSEAIKGPHFIREATALYNQIASTQKLKQADFIEGDEIFHKDTDVVVMDGFTGNVLLKFAEGLAKFFFRSIKNTAKKSLKNMLCGLFAKSLMKDMSALDPHNHNTAILMGLDGLVIKAHGNSNAKAFASSLKYAAKMCKSHDKIAKELSEYGAKLASSGFNA